MEDVATNPKLLCFDTAQRHNGLLSLYLMIRRCRKETEIQNHPSSISYTAWYLARTAAPYRLNVASEKSFFASASTAVSAATRPLQSAPEMPSAELGSTRAAASPAQSCRSPKRAVPRRPAAMGAAPNGPSRRACAARPSSSGARKKPASASSRSVLVARSCAMLAITPTLASPWPQGKIQ